MTHYKIKTAAGREFRVYSPNYGAAQRTAKIEDMLALEEEEEPEERPITAEDILGIGAKK